MKTWSISRRCEDGSAFGIRAVLLAITAAGIALTASATVPEGVSPGAVDRIAAIRTECPTFSWGAVEGASRYEIVVYELATGVDLEAGLELSPDNEVLYTTIIGGATAWTPELDRCLAPGGRYVWFVRAVFAEYEALDSTEWSKGRFFSVASAPSAAEVEHALDVLQRYENQDGARIAELDQPESRSRSNSSERPSVGSRHTDSPAGPKSVPAAAAAIKGTIPDPTGETYGVVGISSSPEGAGVAAANTAGGPDLVLDGSEDLVADAELSESGIDRPSGSPRASASTTRAAAGCRSRWTVSRWSLPPPTAIRSAASAAQAASSPSGTAARGPAPRTKTPWRRWGARPTKSPSTTARPGGVRPTTTRSTRSVRGSSSTEARSGSTGPRSRLPVDPGQRRERRRIQLHRHRRRRPRPHQLLRHNQR